jgi:hypothetical protein
MHYTLDLKNEVWVVCRTSKSWESDGSLSDSLRTVESDTTWGGGAEDTSVEVEVATAISAQHSHLVPLYIKQTSTALLTHSVN